MDNEEMEDKKPVEGLPAEEQNTTPEEGSAALSSAGAAGAGKAAAMVRYPLLFRIREQGAQKPGTAHRDHEHERQNLRRGHPHAGRD